MKVHEVDSLKSLFPVVALSFICRYVNGPQPVDKQQQDGVATALNSACAGRLRTLGPLCCQLN